jgi:hypothetical protein
LNKYFAAIPTERFAIAPSQLPNSEMLAAALRYRTPSTPQTAIALFPPKYHFFKMAILLEQSTRGQKGYDLTESFFLWFNKVFSKDYLIRGPVRAGRDVMLNEVLDNWQYKTPADILISRLDGTPSLPKQRLFIFIKLVCLTPPAVKYP